MKPLPTQALVPMPMLMPTLLLALLLAAVAALPAHARGAGGAGGGAGAGAAGGHRYGIGYQARQSTLGTVDRASPTPSSPRVGPDVTPGWTLMTPREQAEHRERMDAMRSHEACTAYLNEHRAQMAARAKERDGQTLAPTRRDACADLKP